MFKSNIEEVGFQSDPSSAEVWIDGTLIGNTPIKYMLRPKREYDVEFRYQGQVKTAKLKNTVGLKWVLLDCLWIAGPLIIDAVTGNWYTFKEKNIKVIF